MSHGRTLSLATLILAVAPASAQQSSRAPTAISSQSLPMGDPVLSHNSADVAQTANCRFVL
jgi:hypothetical protein